MRNINTKIHLLCFGLATFISTLTLPADTVQHVINVPSTSLLSGETPLPFTVPQFDSTLGSLVAVHVSAKSTLDYNSFVLNFGSPASVTVDYNVAVNLYRPDASVMLGGNVTKQEQTFVDTFGEAVILGAAETTTAGVFAGAADLGLFTGTGNVALNLGATDLTSVSNPFNFMVMSDLHLAAEVTVTYEYEVVSTTQEVVLEIQPSVNLKSQGVLPVAILSTADFSALDIDVSTLLLGDPALTGTVAPLRAAVEDVNGDGLADLVVHFSTPALVSAGAVGPSSVELALSGTTTSGGSITGADAIRIVPGSSKGKGK
jgi:hypothetical protein